MIGVISSEDERRKSGFWLKRLEVHLPDRGTSKRRDSKAEGGADRVGEWVWADIEPCCTHVGSSKQRCQEDSCRDSQVFRRVVRMECSETEPSGESTGRTGPGLLRPLMAKQRGCEPWQKRPGRESQENGTETRRGWWLRSQGQKRGCRVLMKLNKKLLRKQERWSLNSTGCDGHAGQRSYEERVWFTQRLKREWEGRQALRSQAAAPTLPSFSTTQHLPPSLDLNVWLSCLLTCLLACCLLPSQKGKVC